MAVTKPPVNNKVQPAPAAANKQAGPLPRKVPPKAGASGGKVPPTGAESGTQSKPDLICRDPNNINDHVKIHFEDVIAEKAPAHSVDCLWRNSYTCYTCWKNLCYKLFTLFSACPLAIIYGLTFFQTTFRHVWICHPCKILAEVTCARCIGRFLKIFLRCAVAPCFEACGQLFHHWNPYSKTTPPFQHGKASKVQFSNTVQTKHIPRNNNAAAKAPPGKVSATAAKAANSGPMRMSAAGKPSVGSGKGKVAPAGKNVAPEPEAKKEKGCVIM